jgi:hypothetical protein
LPDGFHIAERRAAVSAQAPGTQLLWWLNFAHRFLREQIDRWRLEKH